MKLKRPMKYYLLRLFRLNASPHQVAMGLTLGFVPNWFPTFGLGLAVSAGLAKLTNANIIAAVIGGLIGTPLWPLLFLQNFKVGSFFNGQTSIVDELESMEYTEVVSDTLSSLQLGSLQFLVGALTNVLITSLFLYFIVYILFKKYRRSILAKLK